MTTVTKIAIGDRVNSNRQYSIFNGIGTVVSVHPVHSHIFQVLIDGHDHPIWRFSWEVKMVRKADSITAVRKFYATFK